MGFDWGGFGEGLSVGAQRGLVIGQTLGKMFRDAKYANESEAIDQEYDSKLSDVRTRHAAIDAMNKGEDVQSAMDEARGGYVPVMQPGTREIAAINPETGKWQATADNRTSAEVSEDLYNSATHIPLQNTENVKPETVKGMVEVAEKNGDFKPKQKSALPTFSKATREDEEQLIALERQAAHDRNYRWYVSNDPEKARAFQKEQAETQFRTGLQRTYLQALKGDARALGTIIGGINQNPELAGLQKGDQIVPDKSGNGTFMVVGADGTPKTQSMPITRDLLEQGFKAFAISKKLEFDGDIDKYIDRQLKLKTDMRADRKLANDEYSTDVGAWKVQNDARMKGQGTESMSQLPKGSKIADDPQGRVDKDGNPLKIIVNSKTGETMGRYGTDRLPRPYEDITPEEDATRQKLSAQGWEQTVRADSTGKLKYAMKNTQTGEWVFADNPSQVYQDNQAGGGALPFPTRGQPRSMPGSALPNGAQSPAAPATQKASVGSTQAPQQYDTPAAPTASTASTASADKPNPAQGPDQPVAMEGGMPEVRPLSTAEQRIAEIDAQMKRTGWTWPLWWERQKAVAQARRERYSNASAEAPADGAEAEVEDPNVGTPDRGGSDWGWSRGASTPASDPGIPAEPDWGDKRPNHDANDSWTPWGGWKRGVDSAIKEPKGVADEYTPWGGWKSQREPEFDPNEGRDEALIRLKQNARSEYQALPEREAPVAHDVGATPHPAAGPGRGWEQVPHTPSPNDSWTPFGRKNGAPASKKVESNAPNSEYTPWGGRSEEKTREERWHKRQDELARLSGNAGSEQKSRAASTPTRVKEEPAKQTTAIQRPSKPVVRQGGKDEGVKAGPDIRKKEAPKATPKATPAPAKKVEAPKPAKKVEAPKPVTKAKEPEVKQPVKGKLISKPGDRLVPGVKGSSSQKSSDWKYSVKEGDMVVAMEGGKVLMSQWVRGAGHVVVIEDNKGRVHRYTNVDSKLQVGDKVKRGGAVGNAGFVFSTDERGNYITYKVTNSKGGVA